MKAFFNRGARGFGLSVILVAGAALAHDGVKDPQVKARMEVMEGLGAASGVLFGMVKGERAFDADAANAALGEIAAKAGEIAPAFEPEATDPESEAKPVIWTQFDDFAAHADELGETAKGLTVMAEADLRPAVQALGGACGGCHKVYKD